MPNPFTQKDQSDTGGYGKPVYKTPQKPVYSQAPRQQTQQNDYSKYMQQMEELQRIQQEKYAQAMQDRAAALVKWQQEQVAAREQQKEQNKQKLNFSGINPMYQGFGSALSGAQGTIAGRGSGGFDWSKFLSGMDWARNLMNPQLNIPGNSYYNPEFETAIGAMPKPSYAPPQSKITQPSGNFTGDDYLYPYSGGGYTLDGAEEPPPEETGGGGGYGYGAELPYLPGWGGGGGWGFPSYDYKPYEEKPYYKNQVGGIYWRI